MVSHGLGNTFHARRHPFAHSGPSARCSSPLVTSTRATTYRVAPKARGAMREIEILDESIRSKKAKKIDLFMGFGEVASSRLNFELEGHGSTGKALLPLLRDKNSFPRPLLKLTMEWEVSATAASALETNADRRWLTSWFVSALALSLSSKFAS